MKLAILAGALALVLSACAGGSTSDACATAQKAVALAEASIAAYPDPASIPAALTDNLATAKAALPLFCPAPATVVVKG